MGASRIGARGRCILPSLAPSERERSRTGYAMNDDVGAVVRAASTIAQASFPQDSQGCVARGRHHSQNFRQSDLVQAVLNEIMAPIGPTPSIERPPSSKRR